MRASGILMPIFSLPSPYGIGTLGKEAYTFVDFLHKAEQSYWQILPLNPTNFGDSPYQSFSAIAGNPYFIDLDMLCKQGLLYEDEFRDVDFGHDKSSIDYGLLYLKRYDILRKAFERFDLSNPEYQKFIKAEKGWLDDYALFMAIKQLHGGKSWREWDSGYKFRKDESLDYVKQNHSSTIEYYKFLQFMFFSQWHALKKYANSKGIKIIGDMPIYVADDSVDVWANTEIFDLDKKLDPKSVAGCPPDAFSDDGQLWGMPVYNWDYMKNQKNPYAWWKYRVNKTLSIYDIVRIDHFRGFEAYFCIKFGAQTARKGVWRKGPGMDLFNALSNNGKKRLPIIAEDLGTLTPGVKKLLEDSTFPGMKVLQFAFDGKNTNDYLPHNYTTKNCVVYTGTHDNDTILGWQKTIDEGTLNYVKLYLNCGESSLNWGMMRVALSSIADTAILCMQDIIGAGSEARINCPSTVGENWKWRIDAGCINDWLANVVAENTRLYKRERRAKK